jgi:hypothetical protein
MTAPERFAEKSDSLLHRGRRPYMTHSVISPPSIIALRYVLSITFSTRARSVGGIVNANDHKRLSQNENQQKKPAGFRKPAMPSTSK